MKKIIAVLLSVLLVAGIFAGCQKSPSNKEKSYCTATLEDNFTDDVVLVTLTNEASLQFREYTIEDFPEVEIVRVKCYDAFMFDVVRENMAILATSETGILPEDCYQLYPNEFHSSYALYLKEPSKQNVLDIIHILEQRDDVYCADPNYILEPCAVPDDTNYSSQSFPADAINLEEAWDIQTGSNTVYVGVLDSGIDGDHPDLKNRVDVAASRDCSSGSAVEIGTSISDLTDPYGHGTHVAGIIGAAGNNNTGVCGVNWNVKLVSLRIRDASGLANYENIYAAVSYAKSTLESSSLPDIRILNISYGSLTLPSNGLLALMKSYDGLIVCSAGNDGLQAAIYPAQYTTQSDNIISVGATDNNDAMCSFSNYGSTSVDIFAPGNLILSCYPREQCVAGTCVTNSSNVHLAYGYHYMSGTSMSAPYVTGVAALMLAEDPTLTAAEIKSIILDTADYVPALKGKCSSNGRLNAQAALLACHTHSYTYTSTSEKHTGTCYCGATTTGSHISTSYTKTASTHSGTCRICGVSYSASHIFVTTSAGNLRCSICSYTTNVGTAGTDPEEPMDCCEEVTP